MPPRPVLLLVTLITLVGATFSLPGGSAAASVLAFAEEKGTKWVEAEQLLTQRSPFNAAQLPPLDLTVFFAAPNSDLVAASGSEEPGLKPLTLGSKGESVRELQATLKRLGYFYGSVNGVLGKDTQTAINRFQKEAGLPTTKAVDPTTIDNLKRAERSLSSSERAATSPSTSNTETASSPASQSPATPGGLDRSSLSSSATSAALQDDGTEEISWAGWVMGSLAGLVIAGSIVYGLSRSGNRLAAEETDYSLSGVEVAKIFAEAEEEPGSLDLSSPSGPGLNGNGSGETGLQTLEERSLAPVAALNSSANLLSRLVAQPEGMPNMGLPDSDQSGSSQSEPEPGSVQPESHDADRFHDSLEPAAGLSTSSEPLEALAIQSTERIPKLNLVDHLINELHSPDPVKRRGVIWELGQAGDSRAVQPLVDLMLEADSQQRTLILAAIAEISVRTLKPMKRALLTSLQDENSDVRKNAIRDTTRVYDMMAQLSQLLNHAVNDPDPDVQDTAQWALAQLSRLRPTRAEHESTPSESEREAES